jgi:hypothetical protein
MDINFNDLIITRAIIHDIIEKEPGQESATVNPNDELLTLNEDVISILLKRISDAAGKQSKAFVLKVGDNAEGSFYHLCNGLSNKNQDEFLRISIAELLASAQRRSSIPGGYLLILDCLDDDRPIYIAMKAEPHEALTIPEDNKQLTVLNKVFLSPSQKLYKFGALATIENDIADNGSLESINDKFLAFLFDDQFRSESKPAEYFFSF